MNAITAPPASPSLKSRWLAQRPRWQAWQDRLAQHEGISPVWQLIVFALTALAIFSRNPPMFLNAQFYAEDGAVWYRDAYQLGWLHSLTIPDGGYLNTIQRFFTGPALLVPLRYAPLFMNTIGALVQWLPAAILLSPRTRRWANLPTRAMWALLYVATPNAREIHVVLTNSQWHLALIAPLLVFSAPPRGWPGRVLDLCAVTLFGFSGPFGIFLAPLIFAFWWLRRQPWTLVLLTASLIGTCTQIAALLTHPHDRGAQDLGATVPLFLKILGGNVFGGALFGGYPWGVYTPVWLAVLAILGGVGLWIFCLRHASLELRLFILFCLPIMPAGLRSPLIDSYHPLWQELLAAGSSRYWFFPMTAFIWCAVWCALNARARMARYAGTLVLLLMPLGIAIDWSYGDWNRTHFPDQHWPASVARFNAARPGETVRMKIIPRGQVMQLIKK